MTNNLTKSPAMGAIWAGNRQPDLVPLDSILAEARAAGITISADGNEDISDLVPKPETADAIYARFNGKPRPVTATSDDDVSDLIPKAETAEAVWARFNGKAKGGPGNRKGT